MKKNGFGTYEFHIQESGSEKPATKEPKLRINRYRLEEQFIGWKKFIEEKDKHDFESFGRGNYVEESENYKKDIREKGVELLEAEKWDKAQVGSGTILRKLIAAIEQPNNNLVFTSSHSYTREGAPHKKLIELSESGDTKEVEEILFNLFNDLAADSDAFEDLIEIAGKRYGLLAYIFYLKNPRRYMPIAPSNFDRIFNDHLKVSFVTGHNCSWENYAQYNDLMAQTAEFLSDKLDEIVSLIDAHSFLWMIGNHLPSTDTQSSTEATNISIDKNYEFTPPKKKLNFNSSTPKSIEENNHKNAVNGAKGEDVVLEYEQNRQRNVEVSMEQIRIVSDENSSLGYDVISFDENGDKIFIEVKTTTAKSSNFVQFNLTRNEYDKCNDRDNYFIYIVSNINGEPSISILNDRLQELSEVFEPRTFPGVMAKPTSAIVKLKILKS